MEKLETKEAILKILKTYPKLNKSRLARMLGITPQAINNYLKYNKSMSLRTADKIKELFQIEVTDVTYINRPLKPEEL